MKGGLTFLDSAEANELSDLNDNTLKINRSAAVVKE